MPESNFRSQDEIGDETGSKDGRVVGITRTYRTLNPQDFETMYRLVQVRSSIVQNEGVGLQGYIVALDAENGLLQGQQLYPMERDTCSGTVEIPIMGN